MELLLFIGIQATGKSAFYRHRFADSHLRLNLDMLGTRHRETILFEACLTAKQPVVIDNTNPTREERRRYIAPALEAGFEVNGYFFQSRVLDACRRNLLRPSAAQVPEIGIRGTSGRLQLPAREEGFRNLYFVRLLEEAQGFHVEEWRDEVR